jgi:hypothetical protein
VPAKLPHSLSMSCLGLAALSCGPSNLRPPVQPSASPQPALAASAPEAPLDASNGLVVGTPERLELWSSDGKAHRTLSDGPAMHPLRMGSDAVLALSGPSDGLQGGAQLVRISLQDGARTVLANLPPFACAKSSRKEAEDEALTLGLDIEDSNDFELDAGGKVACLTLMDRNANMANLQLQVRVELDTGRVERWLTLGEDECKAPRDVKVAEPPRERFCGTQRPHAAEPTTRYAYAYDSETGWVVQNAAEPLNHTNLLDFLEESASATGRWQVLGGNFSEGDYIHRNLLLLDREDGALYPVLAEPSAWPVPLKAAGAERTVTLPADVMADVVGESDVRWIRVSPGRELLVVDQLVIEPEGSSWAFKGQLAH